MKVRRVKFDFSKEMPLHYINDNIFSTHFVNSIHIIFPEGEKFFIRSLQKLVPKIDDKEILKQIREFSGQEGTHAHQHHLFWKKLREQGFDIDPFVNFFDQTCFQGLEKIIYEVYGEEYGAKIALAVTAALEHYTAMLAEMVLENPGVWEDLPENMRHLLFWHAAEEIEHKAVAYDVLQHVDDSYQLRAFGMFIATTILFGFIAIGTSAFFYQDPEKKWLKMPKDFLVFIRHIGHPAVRKFVTQWYKFFDKSFNPAQIDNMHLAINYFEEHKARYEKRA